LVGVAFTGFGVWQLKWLGLQAALFIALGVFLLYAAVANYLEARKYRQYMNRPGNFNRKLDAM
jgi:sulfite exporter TauE/SafE